jgi:enoyl-CoA hydratase/carnithine racemase
VSALVIRVSTDQHVQLCTIERPERRNAFDQEHYVALAEALASATTDDDVHVVVITGVGASFSAGQDLKEMAALAAGTGGGAHDGFPRLVDQLDTFPKPLLAAVNGDAVGIGLTMLLHCDIAVVAHDARLRVPFSELGVPPEAGSSALLADVVGWQQAAELLLTSRWLDGDEAVAMGLALRAVPRADVLDHTVAIARRIAAQSPWAVRTAKRLMLAGRGDRSRTARRLEDAAFAELFRGAAND